MAVVKVFHWLQLLSFMAPVVKTLKKVWKDIFLIGGIIVLVAFSHSFGFYYIGSRLGGSNETCKNESTESNKTMTPFRLDAGTDVINKFRRR